MKLLKKSAAKTVSILLSFVMILSLFTVIPVPVQAAEVCTDILTVDDIGATGTNYVNWTARSGENHTSIGSAAVYSGNSAKGNGGIQLRSKSQSGVVTTVSGGIVRKITVAWVDTDRNNDRYLDVYGSNTAYSSAADLYSDARGTLLETFFYNDASYNEADGVYYSEVEVSDDYSFFGFRSQKDALYLSSVTVDWEISDVNRVWNWAADYSSATCTFTDESESHTEDAAITSEVTKQPSYLAEGVLTHTATVIYNGVTYRDVQTEPIDKPEFGGSVPYIDENGGLTDSPAGTQLLTGNEGNLSGGWYTFAADTSVDNLTFSGDVRLVLCDGVTVSSNGNFTVNGTLIVYGQSTNSGILAGIASGGNTIIGGSGNLIINGGSYRWVGKSGYGYVEIRAGGLTVNGGSFTNCNLSADNFVTVNGGTVNNDENTRISCPNGTVTVNGGDIHLRSDASAVDCGSFVFGGGSFSTEGGRDGVVYSHDKSVTLNWTNESDSIYVGQYGFWQYIGDDTYRFDGFNMTLQKNFIDQDGAKYPAGTYFSDDLRYKTLRPDVDRWNQLQQEINDSDSGDVIRLTSDCIAAPDDSALVVPEEKDDLTIDLNGYTIDRGLADKDAVTDGNVITNNGTLVLTGGGTVTGGKNTSNGGAIVNNGGLVILDTTISGNTTTKDGGAIYNSGTLTLNGTTITSNSAGSGTSGSGGAISAHAGTITIVDAEITDNTAASHGGAIYLGTKDGKSATLNLEGGTITGNTAGNQGGGILHIGILNVKGSPAVYDNTAKNGNNIYLRPSKLINVTGTLSSYLNLGVTRENGATDVFTSNLSSNGTHESFFSDNPDFYIADNGSGEALLQRYYVFSFDANGGSGTQEPVRSATNSANLEEMIFSCQSS